MVEPVEIANALNESKANSSSLNEALKNLAGKKFTITAGPTREPLDPVSAPPVQNPVRVDLRTLEVVN